MPDPLFYTDLQSGPVGAIVTVYGANLTTPVSVSGVAAVTVGTPTATKISFIVPDVASGNITTSGSNALPFTVRAGHVYYVATTGSDSNAGTQAAPWKTIPHGFDTAACGDEVLVMDGVTQIGVDNYDASLSIEKRCTQASPEALVAYPGATVTIGSATGQEYGIRNPDVQGDGWNGFVFANLVIRGNNTAMKVTNNQYWRVVGNDMSCPNGGGEAACMFVDGSSYVQFIGNTIHDTGAGGTKYYHSFYATTNSNHIEVGWNTIANNKSCRGIQFYSTGGSPQYDLIVHDNIVHGQECDGINFSTVDATKGPIEAYNNLVYHVGLGGTTDGLPNYACIASLGYGTAGGTALFYGNTLADCGPAGGSTAGAITVLSGSPTVDLISNLILQNPGEAVYSPSSNLSLIAASRNYESTSGTAGNVDTNYRLISGSPALGAGTSHAGILYDLAGTSRPQSGNEDPGAYLSSTTAPPPVVIAPSNFTASVGNTLGFAWSYSGSVPACSSTVTVNCVTGFALSQGSTAVATIPATSSTSYAYSTALPTAGTYTYSLVALLASGSTNITSNSVTTTVTISPTIETVTLTVTLSGTLSDGTTYTISGPVQITANSTQSIATMNAAVSGTMPSGAAVNASGTLTVH